MCGDTEVITLHTVPTICCASLRRCSRYRRHIAETVVSFIVLTVRHIDRFEIVVVPSNEPHNYLLAYSLTPRSRVLLKKLTGPQLVKEFPEFYVTRRFITAFTSARHLSLSWTRSIQSMPPRPTSLNIHLNIILPSTSWLRSDPSCSFCKHFG